MGSKSSSKDGVWEKHSIFRYIARDEDGTGLIFDTDQGKTTLPTEKLDIYRIPHQKLKSGLIHRIHYRLNPTEAETYTLRIWNRAVDGTSTPYEQELALLYESPAAQADDTVYDRAELVIPFTLFKPGAMYYSVDWSGTPGTTKGMIEVSGEMVE